MCGRFNNTDWMCFVAAPTSHPQLQAEDEHKAVNTNPKAAEMNT